MERILSETTSTAAWKRASVDVHVHDRLGPLTGTYIFDESGGEGKMRWKESHSLVLRDGDAGYGYELSMFENMGSKTKVDKKETGVWEVSGSKSEVILYNKLGNPREHHLEVTFANNKVSGLMLYASNLVELKLQPSS